MGSEIEFVDSLQLYAANYVRNSKAIGVLWGIFTISYAIIDSVAFITPEWLGDSREVDYPARFGLWKICYFGTSTWKVRDCHGSPEDILQFTFTPYEISGFCGLMSVFLALLTTLLLLLFFFCASTKVYRICGWIQFLSAVCLVIAITLFPFSWNRSEIRRTCGSAAGRYALGDCGIRWAYILAVIGCLDAFVLAGLAFILSSRYVKLQTEPLYGLNGSSFNGEKNDGFIGEAGSIAGSRKSLNLHPVLLIPQSMAEIDRFSELSNRSGHSKPSVYYPGFASNIQNFQL